MSDWPDIHFLGPWWRTSQKNPLTELNWLEFKQATHIKMFNFFNILVLISFEYNCNKINVHQKALLGHKWSYHLATSQVRYSKILRKPCISKTFFFSKCKCFTRMFFSLSVMRQLLSSGGLTVVIDVWLSFSTFYISLHIPYQSVTRFLFSNNLIKHLQFYWQNIIRTWNLSLN